MMTDLLRCKTPGICLPGALFLLCLQFFAPRVSLLIPALHLQFVDAWIPGATQPLIIKREYRSGSKERGVFGQGWISNLDVRLEAAPGKPELTIIEADGIRTQY